ncbi:MAG: sulfurtransferase [Methanothrix sp.]|uniref:sulfurtransferase n=1 Tax=Methanothrix sp. TaxID=90426 RepID=UPI0025E139AB|nr:rhodanese-like domain-containing protein [Methanothrix sp.]MBK7385992.1 sulfurtransferase [Methanothrix sp.]
MMKIAGRAGVILILMAIISISISVSIVSPAMDERTGNRSNASGELASSLLIPPEKINISDAGSIIIDISPRPAEYIPGAISIPYDQFIDSGGRPKPANVMARILGEAGVSQDDSVIIYGECQPCGGGPSAATYVFWILKYLGHEDVRLLEGGIDEWVAASNPTSAEPVVLAPAIYTPSADAGLLATYEFVRSGLPLIIDARTEKEFESGSIPGAINIPYESVLDGRRIRDRPELEELFSDLEKKRPVVVYTNTGIKASMIWLPLILLGYDAKIYTWKDWIADHSQLGIDIVKAEADPNPASSGDAVKITVTIRERGGERRGQRGREQPGQQDGALSWRADEGRRWPIHPPGADPG